MVRLSLYLPWVTMCKLREWVIYLPVLLIVVSQFQGMLLLVLLPLLEGCLSIDKIALIL